MIHAGRNQQLIMDTDEERLKNAPGFDSDNWVQESVNPARSLALRPEATGVDMEATKWLKPLV